MKESSTRDSKMKKKLTEKGWIKKLEEEGFENISVVSLKPDFIPGHHTHDNLTTHVILKGELIIEDMKGKKDSFKTGDRVDFPSGTTHKTSFGKKGCTMIVGVKAKKHHTS